MNKPYNKLSKFYDTLQQDIEYDVWVDFVKNVITNPDAKILEVGCGTGTLAQLLEPLGYTIDAFDLSEAMIIEAKNKNLKSNFIVADVLNFETTQKYDYIICFMDIFNYLTTTSKMQSGLKQMQKALKPGGQLLLDVHQIENLENFDEYQEIGYVDRDQYGWTSKVKDYKNGIVHHNFQFKIDNQMFEELHVQKIISKTKYQQLFKMQFDIIWLDEDDYRQYYVLEKRR